MNKFKCGIKPPNRRGGKFWGDVSSPYSEKHTRLVTNDKPSWCGIINQKHSFWEAALGQPKNRSHFREISLPTPRTSIFPMAFGGPLSPQNQNAVQRLTMQRSRTCGEVSTNSCCWYISWMLFLTGDVVAAVPLGHLPFEGTFNCLVLSSQPLSTEGMNRIVKRR